MNITIDVQIKDATGAMIGYDETQCSVCDYVGLERSAMLSAKNAAGMIMHEAVRFYFGEKKDE